MIVKENQIRVSKTKMVLNALKRGDELSGLDILRKYGVYRASSVVHKLRNRGEDIKTRMIADGQTEYACYYM